MCISKANAKSPKPNTSVPRPKVTSPKPSSDWSLLETQEMLSETTRLLVRVLEECKGSQGIALPCAPDPELLEEIQELVQQIEPDERITRARASGKTGGSDHG
jgi:hypothetical protein